MARSRQGDTHLQGREADERRHEAIVLEEPAHDPEHREQLAEHAQPAANAKFTGLAQIVQVGPTFLPENP
jgi:hypothetical protein